LRAERHGRDWDIDPADLPREVRRSRPMSQRMADAFIAAGSGQSLAKLSPKELAPLMRRHMMREVPPAKANVVLHVVEEFPMDPSAPLRLAADLASHNNRSFREDARVAELLRLLP